MPQVLIVKRYMMPTDYQQSPAAPPGVQNNAIETGVFGGTQQQQSGWSNYGQCNSSYSTLSAGPSIVTTSLIETSIPPYPKSLSRWRLSLPEGSFQECPNC
jgi:hypothetical protein